MKKTNLLTVALIGACAFVAGTKNLPAQPAPNDCDEYCPDGTLKVQGVDCPDPAFLGVDQPPEVSLSERRAQLGQVFREGETGLSPEELQHWKDIEQEMAADPAAAYALALQTWRENRAPDFQKLVILRAKLLATSTRDVENLDFLLSCLEDAQGQKANCLSLARGNGLERNLGAQRLALLTANPHFESLASRD